MYTPCFHNSIAALIVPGNYTAEGSQCAKPLARVQREGRAHYKGTHWDHYQFMPVSLYPTADSRARALHQWDKDPTPQLIIREHWHGNQQANLSRWTRVLHRFCFTPPSNSSNSHLWRLSGVSTLIPTLITLQNEPFSQRHDTECTVDMFLRSKTFIYPIQLLEMAIWQKYDASPKQLWNVLSSLLTSCCLPAHLCLWNKKVFHMVPMTGKIIKTLMQQWEQEGRHRHQP